MNLYLKKLCAILIFSFFVNDFVFFYAQEKNDITQQVENQDFLEKDQSTENATETELPKDDTQEETENPDNEQSLKNIPQDTENTNDDQSLNTETQNETTEAPVEAENNEVESEQDLEEVQNQVLIGYNETHFFDGGVSAICVHNIGQTNDKIYVAGNDGYVTSFTYPDFVADTWQVSRCSIKALAAHPKMPYLAIYVTDGLAKNEVSLWNWNQKEKLFTLKFDSSVVSLSWSAKGTYLFVGNTSTSGINAFDVQGNECDIFLTAPGIVHLAATASSEKSVVTYSETGNLIYTNLKKKTLPIKFETETNLVNLCVLKNYTMFAGYKDNSIFLLDALSGKGVQTYKAKDPVFATRITDSVPIWLEKTNGKYCIRQGNIKTPDFDFDEKITVAAHLGDVIFVGTQSGNIYTLQQKSDKSILVQKILEPHFLHIKNIQGFGKTLYALTETAIYYKNEASSDFKLLQNLLTTNIQPNKMAVCDTGIFLWETGSKSPIYFYHFELDKLSLFIRPSGNILSLSCYENNCIISIRFFGLQIYDIKTKNLKFKYTVEGIQDATQISTKNILFAKNAFESLQVIFLLNIETGETLPLPIEGIFAYGLSKNIVNQTEVHCFVVNQVDYENQTIMYEIRINPIKPLESTIRKVLGLKGEELESFVVSKEKSIVTNLSTTLLAGSDKKYSELSRSYSFSKQATFTENYFYALNCDGTISVYDVNLNFLSILKLES